MSIPVSVVIPCYRCAATIPRTVESVARQTALPKEVLLVDDGSGDKTNETLRALAERYRDILSIKVISLLENRGVSVARNTGWDNATQPLIALLDSDDTWHPKKLEIQYRWMQAHPEIALSAHHSAVLEPGQVVPDLPEKWSVRLVTKRQMLISNRIATRTVMLRRDIPFRFDPRLRYCEDLLLWLSVVFADYGVAVLEVSLANAYKAAFGAAGLSAHLWKMERGELRCLRELWRRRSISALTTIAAMTFSFVKYLRRVVIVSLRVPKRDGTEGSKIRL